MLKKVPLPKTSFCKYSLNAGREYVYAFLLFNIVNDINAKHDVRFKREDNSIIFYDKDDEVVVRIRHINLLNNESPIDYSKVHLEVSDNYKEVVLEYVNDYVYKNIVKDSKDFVERVEVCPEVMRREFGSFLQNDEILVKLTDSLDIELIAKISKDKGNK